MGALPSRRALARIKQNALRLRSGLLQLDSPASFVLLTSIGSALSSETAQRLHEAREANPMAGVGKFKLTDALPKTAVRTRGRRRERGGPGRQ